MQTIREEQKKHQTLLNNDLQRRQRSNTQLTLNNMTILADNERNFVEAITALLDFDDSVIEAEVANISAQLLYAMKECHEKINRIHSLIHVLKTTIKTAELNNQNNEMREVERLIYELEKSKVSPPTEYPVKEFAQLAKCHVNTIRNKYHSGELKGRKNTKGIYIAASELSKFKPLGTQQA